MLIPEFTTINQGIVGTEFFAGMKSLIATSARQQCRLSSNDD